MLHTQPLKKIALIALLQCISVICLAQDKPDKETRKAKDYLAAMPFTTLTLPPGTQSKGTLPFKSINVIDARYDTLVTGFKRAQMLSDAERLSFYPSTASAEIKRYITSNYTLDTTSDSSFNLALVVEKYWLTFSMLKDSGYIGVYKQGVIIKAGLMAEKSGIYQPIYQVDTVFDNALLGAKDRATMLAAALDKILGRLINKQASSIKLSKRKYTLDDLKDYTHQRFNVPILTSATYVKGVYRTFDEFKNNAPSIPGYEVGHKGKTDMIFGFEKDSTPVSLKDAWGFSDGKQLYIFGGDNFFPLIKSGNTFNTYGFKSFTFQDKINFLIFVDAATFNPLMMIPMPTAGTFKDIKMPLQLDMETGLLN